jgi:hypothetical protein
MKEDLSLDDMAGIFSPNLEAMHLSKDEMVERSVVNKSTMDFLTGLYGNIEMFSFEKILYARILNKALQSGSISLEEGRLLLETLEEHYKKYEGRTCELIFLIKMGISSCFLISSPCEFYFETGTSIVFNINIANCIEELKINFS